MLPGRLALLVWHYAHLLKEKEISRSLAKSPQEENVRAPFSCASPVDEDCQLVNSQSNFSMIESGKSTL
jgi:hypothetical protein